MSSAIVVKLQELGYRLAKEGYPTATIEQAAARMEAMEDLIVKNEGIVTYLEYVIDKCDDCLGPASDDVLAMIKEDYEGEVPEGY